MSFKVDVYPRDSCMVLDMISNFTATTMLLGGCCCCLFREDNVIGMWDSRDASIAPAGLITQAFPGVSTPLSGGLLDIHFVELAEGNIHLIN